MLEKNKYVPRVNQIDAISLNKDIARLIRDNLLENLQAISPVLFIKFQPELDLLIQSAIWFGSVGKRCSTFGQQLLVLAYDAEKLTVSRLVLHFALTVLPGYVKSWEERRLSRRVEWFSQAITWAENSALVLNILNYFRFLKTGRKPTLIDYFLGLDYISLRNNQRRDIGYKYLTRELLWGGFMEILGLVLPIINFRKLQRLLKSWTSGQHFSGKRREMDTKEILAPKMMVGTTCTYCGERPTLPHHMGCGHIYCYYCLSANVLTDASFCCTICGVTCPKDGVQSV
ncbi:peroxisome biogenesis factor 2 [Drosophila guanche]|uniref:Peroxisome biogenesis factor 2 n=1 Tax=Drosophila guanche TaxID=7266 RepID=A0A3B0JT60_DROGU|nr:peroxisome biogenesis factor 2 [Drosophila guanche]SPP85297.1 blast:Peroxisome biogenesis factor 2 [Drosophila guanche]